MYKMRFRILEEKNDYKLELEEITGKVMKELVEKRGNGYIKTVDYWLVVYHSLVDVVLTV